MSPALCHIARGLDIEQGAALAKIASLLSAEYRQNIFGTEKEFLEKKAVWDALKYISLYEILDRSMDKGAHPNDFGDPTAEDSGNISEEETASSFHFKGEDSQGESKEGEVVEEDDIAVKDKEKDSIDAIFDQTTLTSLKK